MEKAKLVLLKTFSNGFWKLMLLPTQPKSNRIACHGPNSNQCQAFAEVKWIKHMHTKIKKIQINIKVWPPEKSGNFCALQYCKLHSLWVGNQADLKISWKSFQSSLVVLARCVETWKSLLTFTFTRASLGVHTPCIVEFKRLYSRKIKREKNKHTHTNSKSAVCVYFFISHLLKTLALFFSISIPSSTKSDAKSTASI